MPALLLPEIDLRLINKGSELLQKLIHADEMADAAAHYEQMENLVRSEAPVSGIEQRKLQGVNDAADCIDDASGKQPEKTGVGEYCKELAEYGKTCPSHSDIYNRRKPFGTCDPESLQQHTDCGQHPNCDEQRPSGGWLENKKANRRIRTGNQHKNHHMVDSLKYLQCTARYVYRMIERACRVQ